MKQRAQTSISSVFVNFSDRNSVNGGDDSGILKSSDTMPKPSGFAISNVKV